MEPKSIPWADHSWEELQQVAEAGAVVVAPFGSTEQHGPMLPVNMDSRIAFPKNPRQDTVGRGLPILDCRLTIGELSVFNCQSWIGNRKSAIGNRESQRTCPAA